MQETKAAPKKRVRREPEEARQLILATAEALMREEGYAAVTVRRIAKDAGLSSALLHYYYPTADDLLVALYRHTAQRDFRLLEAALDAQAPLDALWRYQTDSARTVLGVEFLALANHRKAIRAEIQVFAEHVRAHQAHALARLLKDRELPCSPECLSMLLTSISRNMIMESAVGIHTGHAEAKALVERLLAGLTGKPE